METVVLTFIDAEGFAGVPVTVDRYTAPAVAEALTAAGWTLTSITDADGAWADLDDLRRFLDLWDPVQP
jgi:hypothetical protein